LIQRSALRNTPTSIAILVDDVIIMIWRWIADCFHSFQNMINHSFALFQLRLFELFGEFLSDHSFGVHAVDRCPDTASPGFTATNLRGIFYLYVIYMIECDNFIVYERTSNCQNA